MTQAGGPAAINGFLYQIIHHIGWLAGVTLSGELNGKEIKNAYLVLEPHCGGDARAEASNIYLVEQYKTRKNGTWAVSDIMSVLRDLRKAVHPSLPEHAIYRFVTDGRPGQLETFNAFLNEIKIATNTNDLDVVEYKKFYNDFSGTNRDFLNHIAKAIRSSQGPENIDEASITFHLLSCFDMKFCINADDITAKIERILRRYVPNLGDEQKIRIDLIGQLFEMLSKGEARLDLNKINALFDKVGLSPDRIRKVAVLSETMRELTRRHLSYARYKANQDVRNAPKWPNNKPVLLITGKSGVGKTWQLANLLETYTEKSQIAILVPTAKSTETLLSRTASALWQIGLNETSEKNLIGVSKFLFELVPNIKTPKVIIAIDDIQDVDLARDLVRQDWIGLDMHLALTVPNTIAQSLQLTDEDSIHVHYVDNFSVNELDALLKKNGQKWVDFPADMKKLLRNPILAGIFLKLSYTSIQNALHSEYEIFEEFWLKIVEKGQLGDQGIVTSLADHMYEGKSYPLPRSEWHAVGLDRETLSRLNATGWLHCSENDEVAFAHDRLLNWAVAKSLVYQFQNKKLLVADLGSLLAGKSDDENRHIRRRLNYVTMDTLWLLAEDKQNLETLNQLIIQLEDSRDFGSYREDLYTHLLPTLGDRAVAVLLYRLKVIIADSNDDYHISLIGKAFVNLARQESVDLKSTIDLLLKNPCWSRQKVAIAILKVVPEVSCLDRLWEIHQQCCKAWKAETDNYSHIDYQDCFAALRAAIALNPDWLRHRIIIANANTELVSELGFQLNVLEHSSAKEIWEETKDVLINKIPTNKPRSLLHCIARFSDYEKKDFIIKHLSYSEDYACVAAFVALSVLEPLAAINRLTEVQESEIYFSRNQWLPVLLHAQPELMRQRILELAKIESRGYRLIEDFFSERPDEINVAILQFVLHSLEEKLQKHLMAATKDEPNWLNRSLDFLGRITNPELLSILEAEAGGKLEEMIAEIACGQLNTNSNYFNHLRENARRVLIFMGGNAITFLIQQELDSEHYWVRHSGLNWAFVCPDENITEKLSEIVSHPATYDENGKSEQYMEFYQAITALAAIGNDAILLEALKHSGIVDVPEELVRLRGYRGRMSKKLTKQALQILQSSASSEVELLNALIIAWLSNDVDLIPAIRSVLRADVEGRVAIYACIALEELGDSSDEFMELANRLAYTKSNSTWGINALLNIGDHGFELVAELLETQNTTQSIKHEDQIIRALYENPTSRQKSINAAVKYCQRTHYFQDALFDIAAEANEPNLHEKIFDVAFEVDSIMPIQQLRAIEGLAKFDVVRAVEAIKSAIQSNPKLERELCYLFVRIAPEDAVKELMDAAILIQRESFSRVVGQSLRRIDSKIISSHIINHLNGLTSLERKAIAELAKWLPLPEITNALDHLAEHENFIEVRCAALVALEHHRREGNIRMLFAAFPSATPKRQWSLLIAILEAADPYLLTDTEDTLWLGNILTDKTPAIFTRYANSVLSNRKRKE